MPHSLGLSARGLIISCVLATSLVVDVGMSSFGIGSAYSASGAAIYSYDALGRVISVSYDTGVIVYYTYDANGNRTQQVVNVNNTTLQWSPASTPCTSNCWGGALW